MGLLVQAFVPSGPVVIGLEDTLERRRGKKIAAKGIYRDPVRSSHSFFVKASGVGWALLHPVERNGKPFDPQALLCTDLDQSPAQIVEWFVRRWQMEVTFEETRAQLGLETQQQWNDLAIQRTTPVILGCSAS